MAGDVFELRSRHDRTLLHRQLFRFLIDFDYQLMKRSDIS